MLAPEIWLPNGLALTRGRLQFHAAVGCSAC